MKQLKNDSFELANMVHFIKVIGVEVKKLISRELTLIEVGADDPSFISFLFIFVV